MRINDFDSTYEVPRIEVIELIVEGSLLIGSGIGAGGGTEGDEWG